MFHLGIVFGLAFTSVSAGEPAVVDELLTAIPRSLRYIETRGEVWPKTYNCASCHHVPMMLWSCYSARAKGYAIDEPAVERMRQYLLQEGNASHLLPPAESPPDRDGTQLGSAYGMLGLQAGPPGWAESELGKAFPVHFLAKQQADGGWLPFPSAGRAPIFERGSVASRMVMLALAGYPDLHASEAIQKAAAWSAQPIEDPSHQLRVLQIMVALKTGSSAESLALEIGEVLALQREDGGWAQTPELPSDAYATGQTLYALGLAGKTLEDPSVGRAASFLLRTQSADGYWPMASRRTGPEDSGAHNLEPITFAATAWAVLGLLAVS